MKFYQNTKIFIHLNAPEDAVCEMAANLSRGDELTCLDYTWLKCKGNFQTHDNFHWSHDPVVPQILFQENLLFLYPSNTHEARTLKVIILNTSAYWMNHISSWIIYIKENINSWQQACKYMIWELHNHTELLMIAKKSPQHANSRNTMSNIGCKKTGVVYG